MADKDEAIEVGTVVYEDLNYLATFEVYLYRLDVVVYCVEGFYPDGTVELEASGGNGVTTDPAAAEVFCKGYVKWDGCSNWSFNTTEVMAHFCTREQLVNVGTLMARLFDLAASRVPHWNA